MVEFSTAQDFWNAPILSLFTDILSETRQSKETDCPVLAAWSLHDLTGMVLKRAEYPTAEAFLPERLTLNSLQEAAGGCQGCPLYKNATQTVFGEGPKNATVMFVGEQPGEQEDLAGKPFVGPAGKILRSRLFRRRDS